MGIFNRKKSNIKEETRSFIEEYINPILGTLTFSQSNTFANSKAMKLSAVYRAVNVISDSVAVLPIDVYEYKDNWKYKQYNNLYYLLNVAPNPFMSSYTFKKQLVQSIILNGNGYILIERDKNGDVIQLTLLDATKVKVIAVNNDLKYQYENGIIYDKADIVHILNYSVNGLVGISTLTYAAMALGTAYSSEESAYNFFSSGSNMSGILRPIAGVIMKQGQAEAAKEKFMNALDSSLGGTPNSVIVLDSGLEYQQISVNPKDSQLLESRQFNFITISQFFGVPPSKIFDFSKSNYNTVEASQIDFLNSTIQPLLEKIELELYRKIYTRVEYDGTELKFDVSNLLRMDSTAQADYYSKMFQVGAITPNEIREKINAGYPVSGGNRNFVQVNVQPLDNLIAEQEGADKQIDNQVK